MVWLWLSIGPIECLSFCWLSSWSVPIGNLDAEEFTADVIADKDGGIIMATFSTVVVKYFDIVICGTGSVLPEASLFQTIFMLYAVR